MMCSCIKLAVLLAAATTPNASAFKLSSLWGSWFGDSDCEADFPDEAFAYPRRDLVEEFGEEGYKKRLVDAFGGKCAPTEFDDYESYGLDVSFPIHRHSVSANYDWLPHNAQPEEYSVSPEFEGEPVQPLGDKQKLYNWFLAGCRNFYGKKARACDESERDRINMNLRQPSSMQNYTELGFKKIKAPGELMTLLKEFWEQNKDRQSPEKWSTGNTYTNHWYAPTSMLNVQNPALPGGGPRLKQRIAEAARDTIQEWTGENLTPSSLYGIRIYKEGAILAPHVDRLPLVSSAIINVAQDVDEPWPIEVYAHDGKAYNITMDVGDMILYESHSVLHGRPFPLRGRYYANVFVHFEPTGHSLRHEARMNGGETDEELYRRAEEKAGKLVIDGNAKDDLPPYILKGTPEEKRWRQQHKQEETTPKKRQKVSPRTGSTTAHTAASNGNLDVIRAIAASDDTSAFHSKDENGWQPLHEAARSGHTEIVEILVENGVDINARPNNNKGGTPLWWAETANGEDHPVSKLLRSKGAVKLKPEL